MPTSHIFWGNPPKVPEHPIYATASPSIYAAPLQTHTSNSTNNSHADEAIEWAKFCMWLRGYLSAIEGKELTAEDSAKIMEKLAVVDPESQKWRFSSHDISGSNKRFHPNAAAADAIYSGRIITPTNTDGTY